MKTTIVTASNDGYFTSLQHLLTSLRGVERQGDISIHVLDVGLNDAQRAQLTAAGHGVSDPGWDIDVVTRWQGVPGWFKAMTARPFLPKHVAGSDVILWLDADIWVQDQAVIGDFIKAAAGGQLAICLEVHRCYDNIFMRNKAREMYYGNLAHYGEEVANRLIHLPMMNSGAFAMRPDHPIWPVWQQTLREIIQKYCSNFVEQTALNVAVYKTNNLPHFLPARYNWMACHSVPLLDEATGRYVEPNLPHETLGMIHLACGLWKQEDIEYRTLAGRTLKGALRPRQA